MRTAVPGSQLQQNDSAISTPNAIKVNVALLKAKRFANNPRLFLAAKSAVIRPNLRLSSCNTKVHLLAAIFAPYHPYSVIIASGNNAQPAAAAITFLHLGESKTLQASLRMSSPSSRSYGPLHLQRPGQYTRSRQDSRQSLLCRSSYLYTAIRHLHICTKQIGRQELQQRQRME